MQGDRRSEGLELNLLENGIDFILKGIDELYDDERETQGYDPFDPTGWTDPRDVSLRSYKYGLLDLFSGFLLLLKERLRRHKPALIVMGKGGKIEDAERQFNEAGGDISQLQTVTVHEALKRLDKQLGVTFPEEEQKVIMSLRVHRNAFEHCAVDGNKRELWRQITTFLAVIDRFLLQELKIDVESVEGAEVLLHKIHRIETVWNRHVARWKREIDEDLAKKARSFKRWKKKVLEDLAWEYRVEKGALIQYMACPNCGDEKLIIVGNYIGVCAECGETSSTTSCYACGELTVGYPWEERWCDNCQYGWERAMERDD